MAETNEKAFSKTILKSADLNLKEAMNFAQNTSQLSTLHLLRQYSLAKAIDLLPKSQPSDVVDCAKKFESYLHIGE